MKRTICISIAAAVALLAASCTKQELRQEPSLTSKNPIEVRSYSAGGGTQLPTKAAIYGSVMPTDRDLVLSAYYKASDAKERNYFKNALFSYSTDRKTWISADEPVYWPMTGALDFLAYSSEDAQLDAQWNEDNFTDEVVLGSFKESLSLSDDLLYGKANNQSYSQTGVPMELSHAKSLIVFTAKSSNADAITITKIEINGLEQIDNAKTQLTITNNGAEPATAEWNKEYKAAADVVVPGIDGISYSVPVKAMDVTKKSSYLGIGGQGILVPEQGMKSFTVYFEQNAADGNVIKESFTYDCKIGEAEDAEWQMGKRYIYELNFNVNEIEVAASVVPWDDEVDGIVGFGNAKFEAYCLANFDANGDGFISYKEAEIVTVMGFATNGMDNLRGIEHFTNLKLLLCTLDWYELKKDENGFWHYYDKEGNEIYGLKTLDVSQNVNLNFLYCGYNRLEYLDVSNNPELIHLNCCYNRLSTLDVSNNTVLEKLLCDNNKISTLDLNNNPYLNSLTCAGNLLTSLDVSKNLLLESLDLFGNHLETLDVSNNLSLNYLDCYMESLKTLYLSYAQDISPLDKCETTVIKYK